MFLRIGGDVFEAAGIMYLEPIPYDLAPGLFVVLIPVVMIVVTFATSATLYEGSPVISVAVLGLRRGAVALKPRKGRGGGGGGRSRARARGAQDASLGCDGQHRLH